MEKLEGTHPDAMKELIEKQDLVFPYDPSKLNKTSKIPCK
jgi:hypothetical protein